jgi:exodeoxyribonuclease-3
MRLVTYNILDGGEGRADPLGEVIEAQRPDVVALIEADCPAVNERIAKRLNMDLIHAVGQGDSVALLTKWTIVESINHGALQPEISKSCLEALVRSPAGEEWPICALHLHARAYVSDESERVKELRTILPLFEKYRTQGRPHLLVGDFNANSPVQKIDPAKVKEATREAWEKNGNMLRRDAVQMILDAGYVDVLHAVDPRTGESCGTFTTQQPGQRVDYVFAHSVAGGRLKQARIETDRLAKYASDHFPAVVEII